jgi:hypothetical protein
MVDHFLNPGTFFISYIKCSKEYSFVGFSGHSGKYTSGTPPRTPSPLEDRAVFDAREMLIVIRSRRSLTISLFAPRKEEPKKCALRKSLYAPLCRPQGRAETPPAGTHLYRFRISNSHRAFSLGLGRGAEISERDYTLIELIADC